MNGYAYAQVRLQARHGDRADETVWRRLQGTGDVANYLLVAEQTVLKPWLAGLHPGSSSHEIESTLRQMFRRHTDEVAHWVPAQWSVAVRWVRRLMDLPILNHLLAGEPVPSWLLEDPDLRQFAIEDADLRNAAFLESDCAPLVKTWRPEMPVLHAWIAHWRTLWPDSRSAKPGLERLSGLLSRQTDALCHEPAVAMDVLRAAWTQELVMVFRSYSGQPAASFAHLALTAIDMERLRGDLVRRKLFPEQKAAAS